MKKNANFLIICLFSILFIQCTDEKEEQIIELPFTFEEGYGPFGCGFNTVQFREYTDEKPAYSFYPEYKGIPADWTDLEVGELSIDTDPILLRNTYNDTVGEDFYSLVKERWEWAERLESPLTYQVGIVKGMTPEGRQMVIVDRNNNLDFSDDIAFEPTRIKSYQNLIPDDYQDKIFPVTYEHIFENKRQWSEVPLLLIEDKEHQRLFYNIPLYGVTEYKGQKLNILSDDFANMSYLDIGVYPVTGKDSDPDKKINTYGRLIRLNGYLYLNNKIYINRGVDRNKQALLLESTDLKKEEVQVNQIGFHAPLFTAEEFTTKEKISLESFKGKYVLIEFCATWCGPCIAELPVLKEIYTNTHRDKLAVISIFGNSQAEDIQKLIEEKDITWPLLHSNNEYRLTQQYRVKGYPTTIIIDPEGIIIEKNIRGDELKDTIYKLVK